MGLGIMELAILAGVGVLGLVLIGFVINAVVRSGNRDSAKSK